MCERQQDHDSHQVGKERVLHCEKCTGQIHQGNGHSDDKDTCASLLALRLVAPLILEAGHQAESSHAHNIDQDGDHGGQCWERRVSDSDFITGGGRIAIECAEVTIVQVVIVVEAPAR